MKNESKENHLMIACQQWEDMYQLLAEIIYFRKCFMTWSELESFAIQECVQWVNLLPELKVVETSGTLPTLRQRIQDIDFIFQRKQGINRIFIEFIQKQLFYCQSSLTSLMSLEGTYPLEATYLFQLIMQVMAQLNREHHLCVQEGSILMETKKILNLVQLKIIGIQITCTERSSTGSPAGSISDQKHSSASMTIWKDQQKNDDEKKLNSDKVKKTGGSPSK
ncbi:MAG: hypothetical protein JSR33_08905 [Proteobacteria bacterium]|nr:hypothetical protein [Pseudomonadota bacterium]